MSRNRCKTWCVCGSDFGDDPGLAKITVGDACLRTWEQYLADTEFPRSLVRPFGPYRYQNEGAWLSLDNSSIEVRTAVPTDEQYRFVHIRCRTCFRHYLGWYVQQPTFAERFYEIFDTSFYWSFDDEPSELDKPAGATGSLVGESENVESLVEDEIAGLLPPLGGGVTDGSQ